MSPSVLCPAIFFVRCRLCVDQQRTKQQHGAWTIEVQGYLRDFVTMIENQYQDHIACEHKNLGTFSLAHQSIGTQGHVVVESVAIYSVFPSTSEK